MALTDHQIAVRLLALDEDQDIDGWIAKWDREFPAWGGEAHSGDCTRQPWTCTRCVYDHQMSRVPEFRRVFGIQ